MDAETRRRLAALPDEMASPMDYRQFAQARECVQPDNKPQALDLKQGKEWLTFIPISLPSPV